MITFITRGHINLELNGRGVVIQGEALFRTYEGHPDFVVDIASIKKWDDGTPVTDAEREEILADLRESARERGLVLDYW